MLKVRSVKRGPAKPQMKFSEWLNSDQFAAGRYKVVRIFAPARFPSGAVIFEAQDAFVKLALAKDAWNAFVEQYTIKKKALENVIFYVVIDDENVSIDKEDYESDTNIARYEYESGVWRLRFVSNEEAIDDSDDLVKI